MLNFLKKYGYYIMLAVCLICIGTMIALAITYNTQLDELKKPKVTPTPSATIPPTTTPKPTTTPNPTKPVDIEPLVFILPVANATVGLDYSMDTFVFSETLNQWQTHSGIDFLTSEAADVVAVCDSTVSKIITDDILNGNTVVVDHGNGIMTYYMSLSSEIPVAVGAPVTTTTKLGSTSLSAYSEFKEGPHLHFEMTKDGEVINPNDYFKSNK